MLHIAAEIIPVEPEQGNACAGKVVNVGFLLFAYAAFLQNQFFVNLNIKSYDEKIVFGDMLLLIS